MQNNSAKNYIKRIFEILKNKGVKESLESSTIIKPWGRYTVLLDGLTYRVKKFWVNPGHCTSLQVHQHRNEHWIVVSGQMETSRDKEKLILKKGESINIPAGCVHRFANSTKELVEAIEVWNGDYLNEDDIIRLEDKYGRA